MKMLSFCALRNIIVTQLVLSLFFLSSCATKEANNLNTAEGLFKEAQEYSEAGRQEVAIARFTDVKNKFPYSPLAIDAELAIADTYYLQESYAEAQVSYQNFRELHPKHPKIDYVIYKTGMSYYMQLPETDDRDLTLGNDVIYHFQELVDKYPQSQYAAEAKTKRDETYERLMKKELYIADFYLQQEKYSAALYRYEEALKKYPGYGFDPRAHYGAFMAAKNSGQNDKQKSHASVLLKKYPNSEEAKKIKNQGSF